MSYYTEPPVLYLVTTTVVHTCSKQQPGQYFRAGAAVTVAFCSGMRWSSTSIEQSEQYFTAGAAEAAFSNTLWCVTCIIVHQRK